MSAIHVTIKISDTLRRKIEALKKYYNLQNDEELIKLIVHEKTQQLTNPKKPQQTPTNKNPTNTATEKLPKELRGNLSKDC